jgi:hypothetical protein
MADIGWKHMIAGWILADGILSLIAQKDNDPILQGGRILRVSLGLLLIGVIEGDHITGINSV